MIRLTNIIAPILKKYRYRDKKDPFKLFNKMKLEGENKKIPITKGNVLLMPIRVSPVSNTFEGLLGYSLGLRGYNVYSLMCGQSLSKCDNINLKQNFSLACSLCNLEQKRFSKTYELHHESYLDNIDEVEYKKIVNLSSNVKLEEIFNYRYKKVSIGKYVEGGVARYLLLSNIDLEKYEILIREYFLTTLLTTEATINLLNKTNPKFVVVSHGIYSTWGAALETCVSYGYRVIVWGRGYIGEGSFIASHNASYLFETINETCSYWEDDIVSNKTRIDMEKYYKEKRNPSSSVDHVNYYSDIKKTDSNIFEKLNLDKTKKRIGVYPNIPWDGKMFSATKDFPDLNHFIKAILEWANQNKDVDVIIRAHPAEAFRKGNESMETFHDIIYQECDELPNNIIYIEPTASISSYEVSEICDVALMYASTLALEFAYARHPVIQVGLNNVSNKGIVFDSFTKEEMFENLDRAVSGTLIINDNMYSRVVKYSNYWINRRHIPEDLMKLKHLAFDGYKFADKNDLKEGNFKILDWFIARCEDGRPFVLENDA